MTVDDEDSENAKHHAVWAEKLMKDPERVGLAAVHASLAVYYQLKVNDVGGVDLVRALRKHAGALEDFSLRRA